MASLMELPVIPESVPVLARPRNRIQVGSTPAGSTLLELPTAVSTQAVVALLDALRSPVPWARLARQVRSSGLTKSAFTALLNELVRTGQALPRQTEAPRLRVAIVGHGPISDLLLSSLPAAGIPAHRIPADPSLADRPDLWQANLTVLADAVVPDPALLGPLLHARMPHLPVHVHDGVGVIGPLVLPGLSSCLHCVDADRAADDPEWARIAAQLHGAIGYAPQSIVRATAALALTQLDDLGRRLREAGTSAPDLVDHQLELHPAPTRLRWHPIPKDPRCACGSPHPLFSMA